MAEFETGNGLSVISVNHKENYNVFVFLTRTVPLGAALVSVNQYGETKQATVGGLGGKGAALGLVEQDEVVVNADVFRALINDFCVWRLVKKKRRYFKKPKIQKSFLLNVDQH